MARFLKKAEIPLEAMRDRANLFNEVRTFPAHGDRHVDAGRLLRALACEGWVSIS